MMSELDTLREQIDQIDRQLVELFCRQMCIRDRRWAGCWLWSGAAGWGARL